MKALLRLFNAVHVQEKKKHRASKDTTDRTIRNGYVLDPYVQASDALLDEIESVVGLSGEKANASFHKSWSVVRDSPLEDLVLQQVVHYITTYGFEELGIYREDTVYVPHEKLKLPKIKNDLPLVVIHALTADEVLEKIISLGSGVALSQSVLDDLLAVVESLKFDSTFVASIKNRELKGLLSDYYGLVPSDPTEFLRYVVSKLTNESLLIKNEALIAKIKASNGKFLDELITKAPPDWASIFLRYKPLFLAMKSISRKKTFFNHLRKEANRQHKPLAPDYLNNVTCAIKRGNLSLEKLAKKLETANVFRKVRLARALQYRLSDSDAIVYLVRNGRAWATDFAWGSSGFTADALEVLLRSLARDLCVKDKVIYIPPDIHYAVPATEKQFLGNFPLGSYISVKQDLIVGIHWTNVDQWRVDLDLSIVSQSGKFGWDSYYRSDDSAILFSGDMTNAPLPNGASEMFYIKRVVREPSILFANYFNFRAEEPVRAKVFVASEKPKDFGKDYMVNPNAIIAATEVLISKKQNVLGLVACVGKENRVYFTNLSVGNSITSANNEHSARIRKWLVASMMNGVDLNALLVKAGAKVVSEKPKKVDIDLSPGSLDKTTILGLMK